MQKEDPKEGKVAGLGSVPAGQGVHCDWPKSPAKLPAAQGRQAAAEVAPGAAENVPGRHCVQEVLVGAAQEPRGQHTPAPAALKRPGAHGVQAALAPGEKLPLAQAPPEAPRASADVHNWPAGHAIQPWLALWKR